MPRHPLAPWKGNADSTKHKQHKQIKKLNTQNKNVYTIRTNDTRNLASVVSCRLYVLLCDELECLELLEVGIHIEVRASRQYMLCELPLLHVLAGPQLVQRFPSLYIMLWYRDTFLGLAFEEVLELVVVLFVQLELVVVFGAAGAAGGFGVDVLCR
jgi:hypothetical protein